MIDNRGKCEISFQINNEEFLEQSVYRAHIMK